MPSQVITLARAFLLSTFHGTEASVMNKAEIRFEIELDESNVPEKITWGEDEEAGRKDTQAVCIAVYDPIAQNTMRIDLWTKDMGMDEMKGFYLSAMAGMAESLKEATGEEEIGQAILEVCERFGVQDSSDQ